MSKADIGLLLDTVNDNTGDKAIRIVMEDFFEDYGFDYEVLNPLGFKDTDYRIIVVGGGHLIRDKGDPFYDIFRVKGRHILNTVGITTMQDIEYLNEYAYVSVRSTGDLDRIQSIVKNAHVVPCVSMRIRGEPADVLVDKETIGFHFNTLSFVSSLRCYDYINKLSKYRKMFIPFTHYNNDAETMSKIMSKIPDSESVGYQDPRKLFHIIGQLGIFVCSSLHAAMFAYANNVPFIVFPSAPKIEEFMRDRGLERWIFRNSEELFAKLKLIMEERPDYTKLIEEDRRALDKHFERLKAILEAIPTKQSGAQRLEKPSPATFQPAFLKSFLDQKHSIISHHESIIQNLDTRIKEMESQIQLKDSQIGKLEATVKGLEDQIQLKDSQIGKLEATVKEVEESLGWRLIRRYRRFNDRIFRAGTRRRVIIDRLALALGIALDEGLHSLFQRVVDRYFRRRRQFLELTRDEQYQVWLSNNELTEKKLVELQAEILQFSYKPRISIVMPVYNTEEKWLILAIDSVRNQVYSNWELCIVDDASTKTGVKKVLESYRAKDRRIKVKYLKENRGISGASNEALTMASGDFVGFLDHDDELTRDALFEVVKLLNQNPNLDMIYSDEDKKDLNGRRVEPFFKPDWSPDLFLSTNYLCHFTVIRKSLIDRVGGFRIGFEGSQDYDLFLRVTELTDRIHHIPKPIYSWRKAPGSAAASTFAKPYAYESAKKAISEALRRRNLKGKVEHGKWRGFYRIRYEIDGTPLVSIVIPTKNWELLKNVIRSVKLKSTYKNYEVIIVDNGGCISDTIPYLNRGRYKVIKYAGPFNFSKINNFAVKHADGDYLLFLNDDVEVIEPEWIEAMLEHAQRPEVGIVGSLLIYPRDPTTGERDAIQHAGVIIGIATANHAFRHLSVNGTTYFGLHMVVRNCSAVTGACAMIRRSVFEEVGGFDENLEVAYGDIDLCLRVKEKGYRIIYTPYAMLYHHECATRKKLHPPEDEEYMIRKWGDLIIKGDPYYNPNLTLLRENYSLSPNGSHIRPLAILLDIYDLRPDLQKAYPEVRNGDYERLIKWAATDGISKDDAKVVLRPYRSWYILNAKTINEQCANLMAL